MVPPLMLMAQLLVPAAVPLPTSYLPQVYPTTILVVRFTQVMLVAPVVPVQDARFD